MKFSICIPNYNYANYVGRTIQSVLTQDFTDLEVLVSDNRSTDNSMEVIRNSSDSRVHVRQNACNVGFAGNLDRAAANACGDFMIMLSSDDLMCPKALSTYDASARVLGPDADQCVWSATVDVIDSDDKVIGITRPNRGVWTQEDRKPELDAIAGGDVYCVSAKELLRRSILQMTNPFNFASTCYPKTLYHAVEGYGGGRLYNPDRWFHWKLLGVAQRAYFIDRPLFAYRWHSSNQLSQQLGDGHLKSQVDEYVSTLELEENLLSTLGLSRNQVVEAFVEFDVARHGLATLGRGQRLRATRILDFGKSVYPRAVRKNRKAWVLSTLVALGPLGTAIAKWAYGRHQRKNPNNATNAEIPC